ncbi:PaaI family thioesterase [Novosphingopyxis sp.]|uniref:PaaI family thioesterase n=1 Tax=Novosphingopyxis sp. TaxID=2709690 RepID=UPI003B594493
MSKAPAQMDDGERFDPAQIGAFMGRYGHGGMLGIAYQDHGPDWVSLKLDWRADLVGDDDTQILASGPIISLMDMATSLSIWTKLGQFRPHATMDLRVDYMRPSPPGQTVIGRGECYHVTRSIGFVRGLAHNGDPADPLAHVTGTFIRTQDFGK